MNISHSLLFLVNTASLVTGASVQWPKPPISPTGTAQAVKDLIGRVLEDQQTAELFQVTVDPQLAVNDKDVFVLSNGSSAGSILISASTGVAAAMGFNYYLKYVADSSCKNHAALRKIFPMTPTGLDFSLLVGKKCAS